MKPGCGVAVVGGLHGAVVVVAAIDLGVAVIETATGVEMQAVDDPVLSFCLVINRGASGVVVAKPHARLDENAVSLVPHDRDRRHAGERNVVEPAHGGATESAAGRLGQVVVLGGFVVDGRNPAVGVGAEGILSGGVSVSACVRRRNRLDDANVQLAAV